MLIKPTISIITVNYNGGDQNLLFLQSIDKIKYPKEKIETIMIDNNSQDDSKGKIKKDYPNVLLIEKKTNVGYSPALNIGIKKAKGEYIFVANNDIIFHPHCLRQLVSFAQQNPQIGIIGPRLVRLNNLKTKTTYFQSFNYFSGNVNITSKLIKKPVSVQWVQGCAMFIPKKTFQKIGLFDEGFAKIYFEDVDLCRRAAQAKMDCMINPQAICYHRESYTIDKITIADKWFYWHKNKIRFMLKHAHITQISTALVIQIIASIYWNLIKKQPHFKSLIKAFIWNIKHLRQTFSLRRL